MVRRVEAAMQRVQTEMDQGKAKQSREEREKPRKLKASRCYDQCSEDEFCIQIMRESSEREEYYTLL